MASVRCEELGFETIRANYQPGAEAVTAVSMIGGANTTTTPSGTSAVAFGPLAYAASVLVTSFGGQVYVTKGKQTPVATAANGKLLDTGEFVVLNLKAGESIAVITATVS